MKRTLQRQLNVTEQITEEEGNMRLLLLCT